MKTNTNVSQNTGSDSLNALTNIFGAAFLVVAFLAIYLLIGQFMAAGLIDSDSGNAADMDIAYFTPLFTIAGVYLGVLVKRVLGKIFSVESIKPSFLDKAQIASLIVIIAYCMQRIHNIYEASTPSFAQAACMLIGVTFFITSYIITRNPADHVADPVVPLRVSTFTRTKQFCHLHRGTYHAIMNSVASMFLLGVLGIVIVNI